MVWFTVGDGDIPLWKVKAARAAGCWIGPMDSTPELQQLAKKAKLKPVYTDDGPNTSNGHWITKDGNHVWIAGPPLTEGQKRLRAAYKSDVAKGPDAFFRDQLRTREHADNPDHDQDHDKQTSPLGHYQIGDGMLKLLGLKQRSGSNGWGNTPFATAYHITSNLDFLMNDEAQDAALAQMAKAGHKELQSLQGYMGDSFLTADGRFITVTDAGLFAAYHKQGGGAVKRYFNNNNSVITSAARGQGLGTTRALSQDSSDDLDRNVENRLQWAQYFEYNPHF